MMEKNCNCTAVRPAHMKVIVGLGANPGCTAEALAAALDVELGTVVDALGELIDCGVVQDKDAEWFSFTQRGYDLFDAVYEAIKEVNKD